MARRARVRAAGCALVGSLLLGGCVSVAPERERLPADEPAVLHPAARELVGAGLDRVLVRAAQTRTSGPLDSGIYRSVAEQARKSVLSLYLRTRSPFRVRLFPLTPSFRVQVPGIGLGSAFVIHPDGWVLTNNHVIRDATRILAMTEDDEEIALTVVARDPAYDLALLRMQPGSPRLPALAVGDSGAVDTGDVVLAIGNPLGLGHTVTLGILSQTGRNLTGVSRDEERHVHFLQSDAAINPGSSGGPLLTLSGAWVGVNTAGFVQAEGLGFAVPSAQVLEFLQEVVNGEGRWTPDGDAKAQR